MRYEKWKTYIFKNESRTNRIEEILKELRIFDTEMMEKEDLIESQENEKYEKIEDENYIKKQNIDDAKQALKDLSVMGFETTLLEQFIKTLPKEIDPETNTLSEDEIMGQSVYLTFFWNNKTYNDGTIDISFHIRAGLKRPERIENLISELIKLNTDGYYMA